MQSSSDEIQLFDHSSDKIDEENFFGRRGFVPLVKQPAVNDYVLVEFDSAPKIQYVGYITTAQDEESEYEVSYLRRREKSLHFHFPPVEDVASVTVSDIKVILNKPKLCGTTTRQNSNLQFDYNFDHIIVR